MTAQRALLAVAVLAWLAALALPAMGAGGRTFDGLEVLERGWEGSSRAVLAWYANPLFVLAAVFGLSRYRRSAVAVAFAAFALALSSFATNELAALTGAAVPQVTLYAGFYVWLAAYAALCAWAVLAARSVPLS
jgi:hypothetical protein